LNTSPVSVSGTGVISGGPAVLAGVSIHCTATGGIVRIYDNASTNSGTILFTVNLAANAYVNHVFPGNGVQARNGLYMHVTAGTIEGSVQIA
jgi:hypothetical protein